MFTFTKNLKTNNMNKQELYVEINTKNYKGIYKVVEFLGRIIAVELDLGASKATADFRIFEIERFCDKDGKNIQYKPNN